MRKRAGVYIEGFLSAPHDMDAGVFVSACRRQTNEVLSTTPVWGSVYGNWPLAYVALIALCIYQADGGRTAVELGGTMPGAGI